MQRCAVCNGRTIQVEDSYKCMNSDCEGSVMAEKPEGMVCRRCSEIMSYQGEDSWGQPNYTCIHCGTTHRG